MWADIMILLRDIRWETTCERALHNNRYLERSQSKHVHLICELSTQFDVVEFLREENTETCSSAKITQHLRTKCGAPVTSLFQWHKWKWMNEFHYSAGSLLFGISDVKIVSNIKRKSSATRFKCKNCTSRLSELITGECGGSQGRDWWTR